MIGSYWSQRKRVALSHTARSKIDEHEQWLKAHRVTILVTTTLSDNNTIRVLPYVLLEQSPHRNVKPFTKPTRPTNYLLNAAYSNFTGSKQDKH